MVNAKNTIGILSAHKGRAHIRCSTTWRGGRTLGAGVQQLSPSQSATQMPCEAHTTPCARCVRDEQKAATAQNLVKLGLHRHTVNAGAVQNGPDARKHLIPRRVAAHGHMHGGNGQAVDEAPHMQLVHAANMRHPLQLHRQAGEMSQKTANKILAYTF